MPDLHQALVDYAALYAETYGRDEPVAELIPAMLVAFLESDRAFARGRNEARRACGRSPTSQEVEPVREYSDKICA
jgi:hypothetical protein